MANNGISPFKTPSKLKKDSQRKRGIKYGAMVMLVGCLLVVPIISILMPFLRFSPFFISIAAVLSFMGGLLRIIYALMFESNDDATRMIENQQTETKGWARNQKITGNSSHQNLLPPERSIPTSAYAPPQPGNWIETNELVQPPSVTESTTRLLQKED